MEYDAFVNVHGLLLASAGVPHSLYRPLFQKLTGDIFDAGNYFEIQAIEDGRQRRLLLSSDLMKNESDIFLVDHAWSFRLEDARKQLNEIPGLLERMARLMCVEVESNNGNGQEIDEARTRKSTEDAIKELFLDKGVPVLWIELDEMEIDDSELECLNLGSKFPAVTGLSLWGNKLESVNTVIKEISALKNLRALWLNGNPVCLSLLEEDICSKLPQLEIYNSKFTNKYGKWAVAFASGIYEPVDISKEGFFCLSNIEELDLSNRDISELHQEVFNAEELPALSSLNLRGNPLKGKSVADILEILRLLPSLKSLEVDIPGSLGASAVDIVKALPCLVELNGASVEKILNEAKLVIDTMLHPRLPDQSSNDPLVEQVIRAMWSYIMTYRLADEEKLDETPIWYVMDELGSAIRHSDEPNFVVAPFMYLPDGILSSAISYTLVWPIKDAYKGEECFRDYLAGIGEDKQRSSRITAWFHTPKLYFDQAYQMHVKTLGPAIHETTDSVLNGISSIEARPLFVYTDIPQVSENLSRPEFTLVDDPSKAHIIWTGLQVDEEFRKAAGLRHDQYVNQFPFEACIVMKHHLARTMQQAYGSPDWLPVTYNMETQLAPLIGDYYRREEKKENNLWIIKPWNMARSIDTTITSYLPALIRLMETGPKICQKYVENPALFQGRKFDLRYIVLLRSLQPLEIFLCDVFWTRLANNKYTIHESSLCDYETHFTVMNYRAKLNHINTHDFVPQFENEHKVKWVDIHQKVRTMVKAVFEGAVKEHPEMHCPTARAIYGIDILIDDTFQPKLLEVTYCPDCTRACKYDVQSVLTGEVMKGADFFNNVFGCLFLNECRNMSVL